MKRACSVAVCLFSLIGFTACTKTQPPQGANACSGEVQRFCATVEPGKGRILRCLEEHLAELGPACKEFHALRRPTTPVVASSLTPDKGPPTSDSAAKAATASPAICTGTGPCVDGKKAVMKTARQQKSVKGSTHTKKKETAY